jgi:sulfate adenylyltransferase
VPSLDVVYTEERGYVTADVAKAEGLHIRKLSGTQFRKMLRAGDAIPEWFAFRCGGPPPFAARLALARP